MAAVNVVCEGIIDQPLAVRLLQHAGHELATAYPVGGKSQFDAHLPGYNQAAAHWYWFALRDLDQDAACAPELLSGLLPQPAERMICRIAVRQAEAWLLGDAAGVAGLLGIREGLVPAQPEALINAKEALVSLARKSRRKLVRQDLVPRDGSGANVGPGYTATVTAFIRDDWDIDAAVPRCPSLAACLEALRRWPVRD